NDILIKELKAKYRSAFDFRNPYFANDVKGGWDFGCTMYNVGNVSVSNISIYHAEYPTLISFDECVKNHDQIIKNKVSKIDSTLEPNRYNTISFPSSLDPTSTNLRVIIWIEYEYLHGKEEGIVFLDRYANGQT